MPQSPLPLSGESKAPDWSRARQFLEGIKTHTRFAIAGRILLGHELLTLKIELGFTGGGRPKLPHDAVIKSLNRTWPDWCKSELGMSADTADRAIDTYEGAKLRLKKLGGQPHALTLLDTPAAKLSDEARKTLAALVDGVEWGDSLKELMEEFRIFKRHVALTGGDTSAHQKPKPNVAEQLAFAFFRPVGDTVAKVTRAVESLRLAPDYKRLLYVLPIVSAEPGQISLASLEADLEHAITGELSTALAEIRAAKADRMKNPSTP